MFETLTEKTFSILALQLGVTWAVTVFFIRWLRVRYLEGCRAVVTSHTVNDKGQMDMHLDFESIKGWFYGLLALDIAVFLVLIFAFDDNITIGIPLFTLWSILTGIELGLCLISVDENLGSTCLGLTALITVGCGMHGMMTSNDYSNWGMVLFVLLYLLLVASIFRLFMGISTAGRRIMAGFGILLFSAYLIYDFNRLARLEDSGVHDWETAMNIAIHIYLDIINLFLDLLDLLSS